MMVVEYLLQKTSSRFRIFLGMLPLSLLQVQRQWLRRPLQTEFLLLSEHILETTSFKMNPHLSPRDCSGSPLMPRLSTTFRMTRF